MSNDPEFMDSFDFGIEFADSEDITTPAEQEVNEERINTLEEKLDVLLSKVSEGSASNYHMDEYKELVESQVKDKLSEVERLVLPLLYNLKKNEGKEYIYWPNRSEVIDKQIQKILSITRD